MAAGYPGRGVGPGDPGDEVARPDGEPHGAAVQTRAAPILGPGEGRSSGEARVRKGESLIRLGRTAPSARVHASTVASPGRREPVYGF